MSVRLELLGRAHRAALGDFENDALELVVYLRRWALPHQERDYLSKTWLAVDDAAGHRRVVGYFSLAAASLDRGSVGDVGDLARLPRFPIPAVLLARLAVDRRVQRQGLGTWLFDQALSQVLGVASVGPLGVRVLITDAKDEAAARFYERRGMRRLSSAWPCRMVLDLRAALGGG